MSHCGLAAGGLAPGFVVDGLGQALEFARAFEGVGEVERRGGRIEGTAEAGAHQKRLVLGLVVAAFEAGKPSPLPEPALQYADYAAWQHDRQGTDAYARQLVHGLAITGMTDHVSWGVYIANFTFLVGVAAAAVMLVIPVYIYHNEDLHDLVIFGELLAVAAILMCLAFVTVDLGRPERF